MTNLEKAQMLEAHYLKQIQNLIELHNGQNQLGIYIYGNENTLQSILRRAKNSTLKDKNKTPWKLMSLYRVLLDYDLIKKRREVMPSNGSRVCVVAYNLNKY